MPRRRFRNDRPAAGLGPPSLPSRCREPKRGCCRASTPSPCTLFFEFFKTLICALEGWEACCSSGVRMYCASFRSLPPQHSVQSPPPRPRSGSTLASGGQQSRKPRPRGDTCVLWFVRLRSWGHVPRGMSFPRGTVIRVHDAVGKGPTPHRRRRKEPLLAVMTCVLPRHADESFSST